MGKPHFVTHTYPNGQTVTVEWDELWDGPWKQETHDLTVVHKQNLYKD